MRARTRSAGFILVFTLASTLACTAFQVRTDRRTVRGPLPVVHSVLREILSTSRPQFGSRPVVILEETVGFSPNTLYGEYCRMRLGEVLPPATGDALLVSLRELNPSPSTLDGIELPEQGVVLVQPQELRELFSRDVLTNWERFGERFGEGALLVTLSLPGFSPDGEWALVRVFSGSGPLETDEEFFILRLVQGEWTVAHRLHLLAS